MQTLIAWTADYTLFVVAAAAALSWLMTRRSEKVAYAATAVVAMGLVSVLVKVAGVLCSDPRPFVVDHVTPLISHSIDNGFPSDHTALAAAVATVVFLRRRAAGVVLLALSALLGVSRVFALVHHWPDVLAGAAIGVVSGAVAHLLVTAGGRYVRRSGAPAITSTQQGI